MAWVVERFRSLWPGELTVDLARAPAGGGETGTMRLDSTDAHRRLGWAPRWDLAAGLAAVVDWHARVLAGDEPRELVLAQIERFGVGKRVSG